MSNLLVSIYVTRKNESENTDDKISVRSVNGQMVVYHVCGETKLKTQITLVHNSLPHYIKTLCTMYTTDAEPFNTLQFNFAGFPTYMVDRQSIQNEGVIENLVSVASLVTSSYFDQKEDGEVDEFDDMPPLVCGSNNCCARTCSYNAY